MPGNNKALLPPSNVIVQNAENDLERVITKRLDTLKADDKRIFHIDPSEFPLSLNDERIEAAIIQTNARLVILDPVQGYLNGVLSA